MVRRSELDGLGEPTELDWQSSSGILGEPDRVDRVGPEEQTEARRVDCVDHTDQMGARQYPSYHLFLLSFTSSEHLSGNKMLERIITNEELLHDEQKIHQELPQEPSPTSLKIQKKSPT